MKGKFAASNRDIKIEKYRNCKKYHCRKWSPALMVRLLNRVHKESKGRVYKVLISVGHILYNIETKKYKYFRPSMNNRIMFENEVEGGYAQVTTKLEFKNMKEELRHRVLEINRTVVTPNTKWVGVSCVDGIIEIIYEKTLRNGGSSITDLSRTNKECNPKVKYNLCGYAVLSMALLKKNNKVYKRRYIKQMYELFEKFEIIDKKLSLTKRKNRKYYMKQYEGMDVDRLVEVGLLLGIQISVYSKEKAGVTCIRESKDFDINIFAYESESGKLNHYTLITDPTVLNNMHYCPRCRMAHSTLRKLGYHKKTCNGGRKYIFPKERKEYDYRKPRQTYLDGITKKLNILTPVLAFDFETFNNFCYHEGLSVSMADSVFEKCEHISRRIDQTEDNFYKSFKDKCFEMHKKIFERRLQNPDIIAEFKRLYKKQDTRKLKFLTDYVTQIVLLGFNNQRYDNKLNMKMWKEFEICPTYVFEGFKSLISKAKTDIDKILKSMVTSYRSQDKKRNMKTTITTEQIHNLIHIQNNKCAHCDQFMSTKFRNCDRGMTCDRIDNSKGHLKDNCVLACLNCNVSKKKLDMKIIEQLKEREDFTYLFIKKPECSPVLKGTSLSIICTPCFRVTDLLNYSAPCGFSQMCKGYNTKIRKLVIPYDYLNLVMLEETSLPAYKHWFNQLRQEKTPMKVYEDMQKFWKEKNCKTMRDFLRHYNNHDIIPMLEIVKKMRQHHKQENQCDMFNYWSISSLSFRNMFHKSKDKNKKFWCFSKCHKEFYHQMRRDGLKGGLSVVYHRYHEKNKTLIRGKNKCKKIIGYDANALYSWALAQSMPTGKYQILVRKGSEYEKLEHDATFDNDAQILDNLTTTYAASFIKCDGECTKKGEKFWIRTGSLPFIKNADIEVTEKSHGNKSGIFSMWDWVKAQGVNGKGRKLVDSLFVNGDLIYSPQAQFYHKHKDLHKLFNVQYVVKYTPSKVFNDYVQNCIDCRRNDQLCV